MSIIGDALRQGIDVLGAALGSPVFVWNGSSVPCVPSTLREANRPQFSGFEDLGSVRLLVKLSDWITFDSSLVTMDSTLVTMDGGTQRPVVGRLVTYRGVSYRITECVLYHGDSAYSLRLDPSNQ